MHAFLYEKMDIDSQIKGKYNYENANYYDFARLDYYELDAFNQPDNLLDTYHIQDSKEYEYYYCKN